MSLPSPSSLRRLLFGLALAATVLPLIAQDSAPGATRLAKWQDDKKGVFLLMFDDSLPSALKIVIPELKKRDLLGTFYINPGKGEWQVTKDKWEKEVPTSGMVIANHTMTHRGIKSVENGEFEVGKCTDFILATYPGKNPRLMSFGRPGVAPDAWTISAPDFKELLVKHNLIERPTFNGHGAMIAIKTAPEMLALADKAINTGTVEYIVFHGVGGEWFPTPVETFTTLLDGLVAKKDQLWITDHISSYKYAQELATAKAEVVKADPQHIELTVKSEADPQLFDQPLTLITAVPADWIQVQVTQGSDKKTVTANAGQIRYDALPNGTPIVLVSMKP